MKTIRFMGARTNPLRQMVIDEPAAYALFETMYGLSLRKDLKGDTWLESDRLNAGAYQQVPIFLFCKTRCTL